MAATFLKRHDVGYPRQANPRGIYAVKMFQEEVLQDLEDVVNTYLLDLPEDTGRWVPHIVSVQYFSHITPQMATLMHICTITIYATGTITTPPIG